jgi:formylglycine-generating enzyme required for sulfatase activity
VYAGWSDADFAGDVIDYTFNVANEDEWDAAVNTISGGGNDKNYVINVTDDFSAGGSSAATFGGASDVTVSLRGTGRTLSLSSTGSILRADGGQNIILRDLTLRGYGMNYNSLVYVNSGTFAMYGGAISGNKMSNNSGAGVYVGAEGTFIMYGGEISDNTASRGYGGGGNGGGVCTSGTFRIINGTIYGKDEDWNVKNTAGGAGAALYCSGTVEYGTFIEGEWSSNGSLTALSYDDTIRVINGVLQPYFISVSTNGSPALSTTALTLTFSQAIPGLSAGDITLSGAYSVTKGQLGEPGSDGTRTIYLLPVSGFTEDGTLSVSVSKEGYTVGGPRTASIYYVPLIEMKLIPAGTFTMGSPASELNRAFEETQHQVTLTKGFYMGKYQVTQAQYQAVMGSNPSDYIAEEFFVREDGITDTTNFPVEKVNWYDAIVFCNKLSILEGLTPAYRISGSTDPVVWGDVPEYNNATWNAVQIVEGSNGYRLPTEAQWEYACRAGTTTAFNWGTNTINSTQANYNAGYVDATNPVMGTYLRRTTDVGSSAPNAWGLYDMHGNVWEMCWDWADSSYYSSSPANDPTGPISGNNRISRGGSWYSESFYLRSANRSGSSPFRRGNSSGFRVVRPSD